MKPVIKKVIAREFLVLILVLALCLLSFLGTYLNNYYKNSQIKSLDKSNIDMTKGYDSLIAPYNTKSKFQIYLFQSFAEDFIDIDILSLDKNKDNSDHRTNVRKELDKHKTDDFYEIAEIVSKEKFKDKSTKINGFDLDKFYNEECSKSITSSQIKIDQFWNKIYLYAKNDSIKVMWEHYWQSDLIKFFKENGDTTPEILKNYILSNTIYKNDLDNRTKALILKEDIDKYPIKRSAIESSILNFDVQIHFTIEVLMVLATLLFGIRYIIYGIRWSLKNLK